MVLSLLVALVIMHELDNILKMQSNKRKWHKKMSQLYEILLDLSFQLLKKIKQEFDHTHKM